MLGSDLATQQTACVDALIIGGGFTGLSAAEHLRARGHSVHLLEQGPTLGGLARTIAVGGEPVESYYHHIFPQDTETIELIDRLGLGDRLEWHRGTMAVLHRGAVLPLDSPLDLLRLRPLSVGSRLRVGMAMSVQLLRPDLRALDERYAAQEVRRWFGREGYEMLWHPLLLSKFGPDLAERVAMAWLVARIRQRASARRARGDRLGYLRGSLGYLRGSLGRLADVYAVALRASGVENHPRRLASHSWPGREMPGSSAT